MNATTVAIDLAKDVFELAFADVYGRTLLNSRECEGLCLTVIRFGSSHSRG